MEFSQEARLKPYIYLIMALRTKAKIDFDKEFYKLSNNSVFGKIM